MKVHHKQHKVFSVYSPHLEHKLRYIYKGEATKLKTSSTISDRSTQHSQLGDVMCEG